MFVLVTFIAKRGGVQGHGHGHGHGHLFEQVRTSTTPTAGHSVCTRNKDAHVFSRVNICVERYLSGESIGLYPERHGAQCLNVTE